MSDSAAESVQNCSFFTPYHEREYIFFAVNVVIVSVLCGLGMIGNVLNMIVLTRSYYQKQSQSIVYVFLSALAFADFFILVFRAPTSLSNASVFPYYINYSVFMAYFHVVQYGLSHIFKHASTWIAVSAAIMFYLTMGRSFRKKDLWVRRNRGRVGVVFVFLFCTMLDMPRFFERKVMHMKSEKCFAGVKVYFWMLSDFSQHMFFRKNYPWIAAGACYIIPLFVILLFTILIIARACSASYKRRERERSKRSRRRTPKQACHMVVAVLFMILTLELPEAIAHVLWALDLPQINNQINQNQLMLIAKTLSLIHSSMTFIVYSVISSEFRKTLGSVCCCLCLACTRGRRGSAKITKTGSSQASSRGSSMTSLTNGTLPKNIDVNGYVKFNEMNGVNGDIYDYVKYNDIMNGDVRHSEMNGFIPGKAELTFEERLKTEEHIKQASITDLSAANSTPMWI